MAGRSLQIFAQVAALLVATAAAIAAPVDPFHAGLSRSTSRDYISDVRHSAMHPALSKDGKLLAYSVPDGRTRAIWIQPLGPGTARKLTSGSGRDDFPSFFPDGKSLVFQSDRNGPSKIYRVDLATGTESPVTAGEGEDSHPQVSPVSGRYIAFDSNRTGDYEVWIHDLKKDRTIRVTRNKGSDFSPAWSPDEKQLAFTSGQTTTFEIWVRPLLGGQPARQVTSGPGHKAHPDWSTDGRIAYDLDKHGVVKIMAVNAESGGEGEALSKALAQEEFPRWLPDARGVVCQVTENSLVGIKAVLKSEAGGPRITADFDRDRIDPPTKPASRANGARPRSRATGGTAGLKVVAHYPRTRDKGGVAPDAVIAAVFDEGLDPVMEPEKAVELVENGKPARILASYNQLLRRLDIAALDGLKPGHQYQVTLQGHLRSMSGKILGAPFTYTFQVGESEGSKIHGSSEETVTAGDDDEKPDGFGPEKQEPKRGQEEVAPGTTVTVKFSRALSLDSLGPNVVQLFDAQGELVPGEVFCPEGDHSLVLTPYDPLREGEAYHVYLSPDIKSVQGDKLERKALTWSFTTLSNQPFTVQRYEPLVLSTGRPRIELTFNRPIDVRTLSRGRPVLKVDEQSFPGSLSVEKNRRVAVFEPYQTLPMTGLAKLHLPAGLTDRKGREVKLEAPLNFKIERKDDSSLTDPDALLAKSGMGGSDSADRALASLRAAGLDDQPEDLMAKHLDTGVSPEKILSHRFGPEDAPEKATPPWIFQALETFRKKGYFGPPAQNVEVTPAVTRYRLATMVNQLQKNPDIMAPPDRPALPRMVAALEEELHQLGMESADVTEVAVESAAAVAPEPQPMPQAPPARPRAPQARPRSVQVPPPLPLQGDGRMRGPFAPRQRAQNGPPMPRPNGPPQRGPMGPRGAPGGPARGRR